MKRLIIVFCLVCFAFSCKSRKGIVTKKSDKNTKQVETRAETPAGGAKVYANNTERYIDTHKATAQKEMRLYDIPASITLAQGILESGSGKGRLSLEANNHFGIKCHGWTGKKIYHDDDEAQECFRKYKDAKYSFRDHSLFLSERKRYAQLFKLKKEDYKGWAKGLKAAGYATDKKYPQKLISLIERYKLYEYDREVLGKGYKPLEKANAQKHVMYTVAKGDTLYSISKAYNMSVAELQEMNDLRDTALRIGQQLVVKIMSKN